MPNHLNHRFEVGEAYRDQRGTYRVVSFEENRVVYDYGGANVRLVLEQLLVFREASKGDASRWIVNRKL